MEELLDNPSELVPRNITFSWAGNGDPRPLELRIYLQGSTQDKFLTVSLPQFPHQTLPPTTPGKTLCYYTHSLFLYCMSSSVYTEAGKPEEPSKNGIYYITLI